MADVREEDVDDCQFAQSSVCHRAASDPEYRASLLVGHVKPCPACGGESSLKKRQSCARCEKVGFEFRSNLEGVISFADHEVTLVGRGTALLKAIAKSKDGKGALKFAMKFMKLYYGTGDEGRVLLDTVYQPYHEDDYGALLGYHVERDWNRGLPGHRKYMWDRMQVHGVGAFAPDVYAEEIPHVRPVITALLDLYLPRVEH